MSQRFENGYIALFLTCVVMLFILGFVSWSVMYSKGYQAADEDHQSAYATHQTAEENYRKCASKTTVEDALSCYENAYNTDREQERAEEDLDAQREMANWAEGMLWATLFIGTVTAAVTSLGVFYVAKTLSATSETLNAARETNQIMRDEQRPWLDITAIPSGELTYMEDSETIALPLNITIENRGKSPAFNVAIEVSLAAVPRGKRVSLGGEDQTALNKRLIDNAIRRIKSNNFTVTVFSGKPYVMSKWNGHAHPLRDGCADGESFGLIYSIVVAYGDRTNPAFFSVLPGTILHRTKDGLFAFTLADIKEGNAAIKWANFEQARLI